MLGLEVLSRCWAWTTLNVDVLEILQENEIFGNLCSLPAFAVERSLEIRLRAPANEASTVGIAAEPANASFGRF